MEEGDEFFPFPEKAQFFPEDEVISVSQKFLVIARDRRKKYQIGIKNVHGIEPPTKAHFEENDFRIFPEAPVAENEEEKLVITQVEFFLKDPGVALIDERAQLGLRNLSALIAEAFRDPHDVGRDRRAVRTRTELAGEPERGLAFAVRAGNRDDLFL